MSALVFKGEWAIGVAQITCDLSKLPLGSDATSWVLRSDGSLIHNGIAKDGISSMPAEGEYLVRYLLLKDYFLINLHRYWVR